MEEIDVPTYFLCPISLQIMKDPVTVSTGITYDRESIEKWLCVGKNNTCPVTKQDLHGYELIPNTNLRRLIQAWCTLNSSHGVERFPTPKPPITKAHILKIIKEAGSESGSASRKIKCLRILRSIAAESEANKRCMEDSAALDFLVSVVGGQNSSSAVEGYSDDTCEFSTRSPCEEALNVLHALQLSQSSLKRIVVATNGRLIESLIMALRQGSYESRNSAVMLLKSTIGVADPSQLLNFDPRFFMDVVQILHDRTSHQVCKAALHILVELCPLGKNRVKAIEARAVSVLVDCLLESTATERRACEMTMVVLDQLCRCAEGRAELLRHDAALAVIAKKILRVSEVTSDRGVRLLHHILKSSATAKVVQEALHSGVVAKLCLVLQVEGSTRTKAKAREILTLHAKAWRGSPCLPSYLISSYPS